MPTWRLGEALCKLVPMVAGTNVFVSTLSITAIALDRFHLIVHPTDKDPLLIKSCMALVVAGVWLLAVLMAAPLLVFSITRAVEPVPGLRTSNRISNFEPVPGLRLYEVCVENPDRCGSLHRSPDPLARFKKYRKGRVAKGRGGAGVG